MAVRRLRCTLVVAALLSAALAPAHAQSYPTKTVKRSKVARGAGIKPE